MNDEWEKVPYGLVGANMWGKVDHPYQFVISEREEGYFASWKNREIKIAVQATRVPGEPWATLEQAKAACALHLERLRG
jgi:hypothetical protein